MTRWDYRAGRRWGLPLRRPRMPSRGRGPAAAVFGTEMPQRSCSLLPNTNTHSGRGSVLEGGSLICRRKPLSCFCNVRPPRNEGLRNQPGQHRPASGRIMSLPKVAIHRVARPSLGKPVVSPLWGHERSIIWQTRASIFVSIRPVRQALGGRPVFAHTGRLLSTLSGHTEPQPWTPQLGGEHIYKGRPEGPEAGPNPSCHSGREMGFCRP